MQSLTYNMDEKKSILHNVLQIFDYIHYFIWTNESDQKAPSNKSAWTQRHSPKHMYKNIYKYKGWVFTRTRTYNIDFVLPIFTS